MLGEAPKPTERFNEARFGHGIRAGCPSRCSVPLTVSRLNEPLDAIAADSNAQVMQRIRNDIHVEVAGF